MVRSCLYAIALIETSFAASVDARQKSNRLHRDISIHNIILVRKGDEVRIGILIDWELSCKCDRTGTAFQYSRTVSEVLFTYSQVNILN